MNNCNELNSLIKDVSDLLKSESTLTADTKLSDLKDWTSLSALNLIAMIDDKYGVLLKGSDFHRIQTIHDLFVKITCPTSEQTESPSDDVKQWITPYT